MGQQSIRKGHILLMARSGTSFRDIAFRKAATRDSRLLAECRK